MCPPAGAATLLVLASAVLPAVLDVLGDAFFERLELVVQLLRRHRSARFADQPGCRLHSGAPGGFVRVRVCVGSLTAVRFDGLNTIEIDVPVLAAFFLVVLGANPPAPQLLRAFSDLLA